MKLVDTHAHLFADEFVPDLDAVVTRAKAAGVEKALLPNIDSSSISSLKSTTRRYPEFFFQMMGLHPTSVTKEWQDQLSLIHEELLNDRYIAVGEIGIDLYWDDSLRKEQISVFEEQLKWSIELGLPVSIHFRNALDEVIKSIERVGAERLHGVFHSFGGTKYDLDRILVLNNFLIGVNGVVTFKNSGLADSLIHAPREKLVLETDAPYLSPMPYRGKRNESAYIPHIARRLALIWEISDEEVAEITTRNASRLFSRIGEI